VKTGSLSCMCLCVLCRLWRCMRSRMDADSNTTAATAPAPAQWEHRVPTSSRASQTVPPRPLTPVIHLCPYCTQFTAASLLTIFGECPMQILEAAVENWLVAGSVWKSVPPAHPCVFQGCKSWPSSFPGEPYVLKATKLICYDLRASWNSAYSIGLLVVVGQAM